MSEYQLVSELAFLGSMVALLGAGSFGIVYANEAMMGYLRNRSARKYNERYIRQHGGQYRFDFNDNGFTTSVVADRENREPEYR